MEKHTPAEQKILSMIKQEVATQPGLQATEAPAPAVSAAPAEKKSKAGKATQLWFHPEDKQRIAELHVWLASQGRPRINDSLIIKSALRAVRLDDALLAAYDEAVQADRRLKKHREQ
jgi:hypothetical protein